MHEMQSNLLKHVLLDVCEDLSITHVCPACSASLGAAREMPSCLHRGGRGSCCPGDCPSCRTRAASLVHYSCFKLLVRGWGGRSCRAAFLRGHPVGSEQHPDTCAGRQGHLSQPCCEHQAENHPLTSLAPTHLRPNLWPTRRLRAWIATYHRSAQCCHSPHSRGGPGFHCRGREG